MYDIQLFNIFHECEIMAFTPAFCQALSKLLNDQLAKWLLDFMESFPGSPAAVDNNIVANYIRQGVSYIDEYVVPRAKVLTIHLRLRQMEFRGSTMYDFMRTANLSQVPIMDMGLIERNYFYKHLSEVVNLLPHMLDRIEARTKENYLEFQQVQCADLDAKVDTLLNLLGDYDIELERNPRRSRVAVADNRDLFYKAREPARSTGLSPIIRNRSTITTLYTGLNYLNHCVANKVPDDTRRTI